MKKKLILLLTIVIVSVYVVLTYEKNDKIETHLDSVIKNNIDMYNVMYEQFKGKSELIYHNFIRYGGVIDIYKQLQTATDSQRDTLREKLYLLLNDDYKKYKKDFTVKQIHFHTANNDSFLRLHRVGKYGDNLRAIRQTVEYVNKSKKPIDGFEVGRVYSGYRFVYPISDENNTHLGSVEISFDVGVFVKAFIKQFNELSNFHIKKDIIDNKVWKDGKDKYYEKSPIKDFYREKHILAYLKQQEGLAFVDAVPSKRILNKINSKIKAEDGAFAINLFDLNKIVAFIPIYHPTKNETIAYMSIRNDGKYIADVMSDFYMLLSLSILFVSIMFYIIYIELNIQQRMQDLLKEKVDEEVAKNLKKERQLIEQSKMANMGAMIGNIAHQWRQPLSNISTIASSVRLNHEFDQLNVDELLKDMDKIIGKTQYLSQTITTFRNFLREKKEYKEVVLQERIGIALDIVNLSLKDNDIKLYNDIDYSEQIRIKLVVGELAEVIINIINNAKDILIENKVASPWVRIELINKDETVLITIEDNGGGIPDDVMPHIFDEYFTTKSEDVGTGLGLHMSYKIVCESLGGKLYAKNAKNGAKFFIELDK